MFDKTTFIAPPSHRGPTSVNVTVTENRAPTDESIKILRDMEEKVRASMVAHVDCNNALKFSARSFAEPTALDRVLVVYFEINGRKFTFKKVVEMTRLQRGRVEEIVEEIFKDICAHMAREMMRAIVSDVAARWVAP